MYICSPKTFPKWDQRLNPILQLDQQGCYRSRIFQCPVIDLPISLGSGNEWWRDVWISLELERILRISETLWICETYGNSFLVILTHTASLLFFCCMKISLALFLHLPSFLTCFFFSFSAEVEKPTLIGMLRYKNTSLSVKSPCRVLAVQPFEQRKLRVFTVDRGRIHDLPK